MKLFDELAAARFIAIARHVPADRVARCAGALAEAGVAFLEITFDPAFRGFEGHFEGNPIVPGVCLLSLGRILAEELTGRGFAVTEIGQCRFRRPIRAGESARCRATAEADAETPGAWRIRAEIRCEEAIACQLRMKAVAR